MIEDLTEPEIQTLHTSLLSLKDKLQAQLDAPTDAADIVDLNTPQGRLSRVDAMQQQKMAAAKRQRMRLRIGKVRQALVAIADDEYGDCRLCGEAIGVRRLTVTPEALLCITCTEAAERRRR